MAVIIYHERGVVGCACQEENDQLDADFHYIKRGQAVIPCHRTSKATR